MSRTAKKVVAAIAAVGCVLALTLLIFTWLGTRSALPNPNGYDDFVKAGQMVTTTLDGHGNLIDYRELGVEGLRAFAVTNAEALKTARLGLSHRCRLPIENSQDWFRSHVDEVSSFMSLTTAFCLAGRLALLEGRTNDAVNSYLDSIRFAHESSRGGLIWDSYIAQMLEETLGMADIKEVRNSLDTAQNRRVANVLGELNAQREAWSDLVRRDVHHTLRTESKTLLSRDNWRMQQSDKARYYRAERNRRQFMLNFAARAYELEMGKKPKNISDLVPVYLKAIPKDPLTRTNLTL